ncbi:hypothetical protein [Geodermatophilus sp. URMC 64]
MTAPEPDRTPREIVADLDRLRARAREHSRLWWFPLALFGALVLLALPFHVDWSPGSAGDTSPSSWASVVLLTWGGIDSPAPVLTGLYWFAALVAGYVGTGLYYRRHALATGLRRPVRWFVTLGLLLTVFFLPVRVLLLLPLWRTTSAVTVILATVVVLAVRERDRRLWTVTAVLAVVTVLVNAYNTENLLFRLGVPPPETWTVLPNVALPGLVLLAGGLLARPRGSRSRAVPPAVVAA